MTDFYEIDFWEVESKKSGDAISIRYQIDGIEYIHVIDCGFVDTGPTIVAKINKYYDQPNLIDHVVVTHPDGDHAGGVRSILETFEVGALWMLRPWKYAGELIDRFSRFTSVPNLEARLKELYPNLLELERIANEKGIPIYEPFQGSQIGVFRVLAPSRSRYLDLVVESEKTPDASLDTKSITTVTETLTIAAKKILNLVKAAWGAEVFSVDETSSENEMSVVQHGTLLGEFIMLTGDAGRGTLGEAVNYAPLVGIALPGIHKFQVPHHGSRRNVSTLILDQILGPRLAALSETSSFTAMISSAKEDEDHPRKSVVRAMVHRGGGVISTEGQSIRVGLNQPKRDDYNSIPNLPYPEDQETD